MLHKCEFSLGKGRAGSDSASRVSSATPPCHATAGEAADDDVEDVGDAVDYRG